MAAPNRSRVFLDVNIGEEPAGRLTIELFKDKAPRTCENFRQLCTGEHNGLSYAKTPFHRVIDEFMVQGGDTAKGDGTGTDSIYDGEYEDENLNWREMDAAGLVCSANRGPDTNGSQFFITLESCEHLNGKHTIFGKLVSGQETLEKIAKVDVDKNDRPLTPVLVSRCGELERKKKERRSPPREAEQQRGSRDRGRRRKDQDSDHEMENSPEPPKPHQARRRQSDNVVDEGLRGRPRQRTHSRSNSRPFSTSDDDMGEASDSASPARKHKRKRSSSPSRHQDGDGKDSQQAHTRRRRSLPNQYDRGKDNHRGHDGERANGRKTDSRHVDRYRPSQGRDRYDDRARLGGDDRYSGHGRDEYDPPVKFKGRGVMKYREPGRL